jgi:hypothetical protein
VATAAKELADYYPDAAPSVDLGRRLAGTFRQLVARPDGSRRWLHNHNFTETLANAIAASDVSCARALLTTAFQYCDVMEVQNLSRLLKKVDKTRHSGDRWIECIEKSLEQTAQTIRNLSMRGSDLDAVRLLGIAVGNADGFSFVRSLAVACGVLEAYRALSRQAKYLALQHSELKRGLSAILKATLPSTEEANAVRKEIEEFDPHLFPLPEVSTGGEIVTIIKKLEEAFANLPEALAGNVGALLHSHIQEFLESASTSSETPDERSAGREVLLGAVNYAVTIEGAIANLVDAFSADEVGAVRSWFVEEHENPITEALDARLWALGAWDWL